MGLVTAEGRVWSEQDNPARRDLTGMRFSTTSTADQFIHYAEANCIEIVATGAGITGLTVGNGNITSSVNMKYIAGCHLKQRPAKS